KSVVSLSYSSTNKAFQVTEDPPSLKSFLNGKHELLASFDIFLSPKPCVQTWIYLVDLEFLDSVVQCLINLMQSAVTELVDLIEPHDHLNPIYGGIKFGVPWITSMKQPSKSSSINNHPSTTFSSLSSFRTGMGDLPGSLHMMVTKQSREHAGKADNIVLREYQIRSKHDWASVSFFSSTSNLSSNSSRVDVVVFVIWELAILGNKASKTCPEKETKDASSFINVET
nr:NADH-ubiquinone oxidoreductase chain [Tanacetum cinerariifolium]